MRREYQLHNEHDHQRDQDQDCLGVTCIKSRKPTEWPMAFFRFSRCGTLISLGACLVSMALMAQVSISEPGKFPILPYAPVPNFFQLPMDNNFVEVAGVAVN